MEKKEQLKKKITKVKTETKDEDSNQIKGEEIEEVEDEIVKADS